MPLFAPPSRRHWDTRFGHARYQSWTWAGFIHGLGWVTYPLGRVMDYLIINDILRVNNIILYLFAAVKPTKPTKNKAVRCYALCTAQLRGLMPSIAPGGLSSPVATLRVDGRVDSGRKIVPMSNSARCRALFEWAVINSASAAITFATPPSSRTVSPLFGVALYLSPIYSIVCCQSALSNCFQGGIHYSSHKETWAWRD